MFYNKASFLCDNPLCFKQVILFAGVLSGHARSSLDAFAFYEEREKAVFSPLWPMLTSGEKSLTLFNTFALFSGHYYESTFFFHRPHHIQYNTSTTSYYYIYLVSRPENLNSPQNELFFPRYFSSREGKERNRTRPKVKRRPWKTSLTWPYVTSGDIGRVAEGEEKECSRFSLPSLVSLSFQGRHHRFRSVNQT